MLKKLNDSFEESYSALPKYCEDIERTNPHSKAILECIESQFRRIFICYDASIIEFQYRRLVLGLDETHLKNKYQRYYHYMLLLTLKGFCSQQRR